MRRALSLPSSAPSFVLLLCALLGGIAVGGCARASRDALRCEADTSGALAVSCAESGRLFCRTASGERCLPAAVACYDNGGDVMDDYVCESTPGEPDESLEAICLVGDFDRDSVERTTPRCSELTATPAGDGGR